MTASLDADGAFEARREALIAGYGRPVLTDATAACRLLAGAAAGLNAGDVVAMRYRTRAFHQLGHDQHGHTSLGIVAAPDGDGYLGVMDVRAQLAAMRARHEAQRAKGH